MKPIREITVSFTLALIAILSFIYLRKISKEPTRASPDAEAVTSNGEPDDPALSVSWGLEQVQAARAWRHTQGQRDIVIAIIDTGCDILHPDLQGNIWTNPGESGQDSFGDEKSSNGIDDDHNGFVDDVHGWNFHAESNDLEDEHGHGTHIAGIIGALKSNGLGSSGVAPKISLMILKYYDTKSSVAEGETSMTSTIEAIHYAIRMGAQIINYSGGGLQRSQEEEEALRLASERGILVVAAAGNEGLNSDFYPFYPADYDLPNILSVAALDRHGQLMRMSNYGLSTVDLAAPGKNIYSTLPQGQYGFMSGTSQATAFVTGAAALLMAHDPRFREPAQVIRHLTEYGQTNQTLKTKARSGKQLNIGMALESSTLELTGVE